jgi:hypothetical protein
MRQVEEIQKHVANIPTHMMYTEMKKLDMKLDRRPFEESKKQDRKNSVYDKMQPQIDFKRSIPRSKYFLFRNQTLL